MTGIIKRKKQTSVIIRSGVGSHASAGETLAFSLGTGVALTSLAIGVWSILAFVSALAGEGPMSLVAGFIEAVTGQ